MTDHVDTFESDSLLVSYDGSVVTLTLNRPHRRNALDDALETTLREALVREAANPAVRVILLTGADGSFCAGKDISALSGGAQLHAASESIAAHRFAFITTLPKPVIAVIDGPAVGIGLMLALYCDIRLASPRAAFHTGFARRGLVAEHGSSWLLPRMLGVGNAMHLLMTPRPVSAEEGLRIGLVTQVSTIDEIYAVARDLAHDLATQVSPRSLRVIKQQVWRDIETRFGDALTLADAHQRESLESDDFREGIQAFQQRRAPRFTGR